MNLMVQQPGSLVRFGNYCCSSIRVASVDENKNNHRKITMVYIYIYIYIYKVFWKQHTTDQQLYRHLPSMSKTIQIRRTRYAGDTAGTLHMGVPSSSCRAASTDIPDPLSPFYLSFIASGWSSGPHPVSSQSCWMYVRAGRPAFARPYVGVHRSTSLMSASLLLQQCPTCLVRLMGVPVLANQ